MIEESKNKVDEFATEVRDRIETALNTRSTKQGTAAAAVEDHAKWVAGVGWRTLRRRPSIGIALLGGAGLWAAMTVGVGELTLGLVIAYGAYQILREGRTPGQAAEEIMKEMH